MREIGIPVPVEMPNEERAVPTRSLMAKAISERLDHEMQRAQQQWQANRTIGHFVIDDLLPSSWARAIHDAFPAAREMVLKKSLRELKYVAAQMDKYQVLLEDALYAFQEPVVVGRIQQITGLRDLEPDGLLYAGGISLMAPGHFLNPHVDNSHDKFRQRYRVLNLLYYVSPAWQLQNGCNLELWMDGPAGAPTVIESRFNRLVVMVTHQRSWHSVSRNLSSANRCCVSNYYFSKHPVGDGHYFHVTSFRGRPEQRIRDLVLRADILLRSAIRTVFPKGIRENPHFYRKRR